MNCIFPSFQNKPLPISFGANSSPLVVLLQPVGHTVAADLGVAAGTLPLPDVAVVEEVPEEDKVGEVHEEAELDVLVGHVALLALRLHLEHPEVDQAAHDHLEELQRGDDHRQGLRNAEPEGEQGQGIRRRKTDRKPAHTLEFSLINIKKRRGTREKMQENGAELPLSSEYEQFCFWGPLAVFTVFSALNWT